MAKIELIEEIRTFSTDDLEGLSIFIETELKKRKMFQVIKFFESTPIENIFIISRTNNFICIQTTPRASQHAIIARKYFPEFSDQFFPNYNNFPYEIFRSGEIADKIKKYFKKLEKHKGFKKLFEPDPQKPKFSEADIYAELGKRRQAFVEAIKQV